MMNSLGRTVLLIKWSLKRLSLKTTPQNLKHSAKRSKSRRYLAADVSDATFTALTTPGTTVHGAMARDDDGTPIGIVHWLTHASTWALGDYCYLEDLYVSPDARGTGAGRALIAHVRDWAAEHGAAKVYWLTAEGNTTARTLYDRVAAAAGPPPARLTCAGGGVHGVGHASDDELLFFAVNGIVWQNSLAPSAPPAAAACNLTIRPNATVQGSFVDALTNETLVKHEPEPRVYVVALPSFAVARAVRGRFSRDGALQTPGMVT